MISFYDLYLFNPVLNTDIPVIDDNRRYIKRR